MKRLSLLLLFCLPLIPAEVTSGPPLPYKVVKHWVKLPEGWNLGETSGVDVDKNDNVWVFNRGAHPVVQLDRDGNFIREWKEVPIKSSHGIRVDPTGDIWTVDVMGHAVLKFTPNGRLLMAITQPRNGPGTNETKDGFNQPTGVAFAKDGSFFVSDGYVNSRVVHFDKNGAWLGQWGTKGTGDGEFNLVHDVQIDKAGRVYVADRSNSRVQVFDQKGNFITKWTNVGQPWGLYYVERENAIYMCDGLNNRVVKLNTEGQILGTFGSHGKAPGQLDFAHNIAVDSTGAIYVAEIKNWRVSKFVKE